MKIEVIVKLTNQHLAIVAAGFHNYSIVLWLQLALRTYPMLVIFRDMLVGGA